MRNILNTPKVRNLYLWFSSWMMLLGIPTVVTASTPQLVTAKIVPQHFLHSYDPITVIFSHAIGPKQARVEDHGPRYIVFQPTVTGVYQWLDGRTLEFRPTQPWPALQFIQIRTGSEHIGQGKKDRTYSLQATSRILRTLLPSPSKIKPESQAGDIRNLGKIELTFPRPLPLDTLRQALHVEIRPLPGLLANEPEKILSAQEWWLKQAQQTSEGTTYWLVLRHNLPKARHIAVKLQLALQIGKTTAPLPLWTSTFTTQKPFRLEKIECGREHISVSRRRYRRSARQSQKKQELHDGQERAIDCSTGGNDYPSLQFSRPLGENNPGVLRQLIRISPTVGNIRLEKDDDRLWIKGNFQRSVLYRLTVEGGSLPIVDDAGQTLHHDGQQTVFFYLGQKSPILQWTQGRGMIERHGPQMMPFRIRGVSKVDLRIHPIVPGDNRFWPLPGSVLEIDETQPPPASGEIAVVPGASDLDNKTQLQNYLKTLGTPKVSKIISLLSSEPSSQATLGLDLAQYLKGLLPPHTVLPGFPPQSTNHFLVGIRRLDGDTHRKYTTIQVTDLALATVEEQGQVRFVVTSLHTAQPISGALVALEGITGRPQQKQWITLWQGKTDTQGFTTLPRTQGLSGTPSRIRVQFGEDRMYLNTRQSPPIFVSSHWWPSHRPWLSWLHERSLPPVPEQYRAHLFTERPVYRPGDVVHLKGLVRAWKDGRLQLADARQAAKQLQLVVQGPQHERWIYQNLKLSDLGGIYKEFSTPKSSAGSYTATLYSQHADGRQRYLASRDFKVEAYRIPRFEVNVLAPTKVPGDEKFEVRALAKYYAGGLVVERPIQWRVVERVIDYQPAIKKDGFVFASSHRYSQAPSRRSRLVFDRTEKIDKQGQAALTIDPTLNLDLHARRYAVEATVRGADGRDISGFRSVLVLPPFILGAQLKQRFHLKPGPIQADVIAVGVKDTLVAGVPIKLTLLRREWHSHLMATDFVQGEIKYRTEVVDREVATCQFTSQEQATSCPLAAKTSGVYVLQIQGKDKLGRTQTLSLDMYVRGQEQIAWARSQQAVYELSTDRKMYEDGQTANILVRSPFQTARGLVIVEDPTGTRYHWINIKGGQSIFRLPIERHYAPSVTVHIVLMRGRVALPSTKQVFDPGRPQTVASTIALQVDPKQNRLMLAMKLPKEARPRQEVEVELQLHTPDGKPTAGEVTLWAVDRAVLSLGKEGPLDPLQAFIKWRPSHIRIRDTRNLTVGRLPQRPERAGGDGGTGIGEGFRTVLRKNFKSVAYYNPVIAVDASGTAKVRFRLPDDLTTFAVRAVAMSGTHRFGFKAQNMLVRLPVMIQRALPRFVRPGDRFLSGGVSRVTDQIGGAADSRVSAEGMQIIGASQQSLELPTRKAIPVFYSFAVPYTYRSQASVQMSILRHKDKEKDAFHIDIPVEQDQQRVYLIREATVATLGNPLSLLSQWPEPIRAESGQVEVLFAGRGELLRTAAAMEYLLEYPFGCTEQRVSRAYPMLVLRNTLQQFAVRHFSTDRMKQAVSQTIEHLKTVQHRDGLFGYWSGSTGDLGLSAYSAAFLLEARDAGYVFPEAMLTQALRALRKALRSDFVAGLSEHHLQERAVIVSTLAQANWHEPDYVRRLFTERNKLDLFGRSQLLLAMARDAQRHQSRMSLLVGELESRVLVTASSTDTTFAGLNFVRKDGWYGFDLSSKTRTLAAITEALSSAKPGSTVVPLLEKALLDHRIASRLGYGYQNNGTSWGSTQNNARALLAIRALLQRKQRQNLPKLAFQTYQKQQASWSPAIAFGGEQSLWPMTIRTDETLLFKVTGETPKEPLWIRARFSYIPAVRGSQASSLNQGLSVMRNTTVVGKTTQEDRYYQIEAGTSRSVEFGAILEESVRLITGETQYHVAVEVPIAAGVEVMNPALLNESSQARPQQQDTIKPTHTEYLDDRVRFFFSYLPAGDHRVYFRVRATTSGRFTYPPARSELMYNPTVFGRSPGYTLEIKAPATQP